MTLKPLPAKSEPIGYKKATKRRPEVPFNGMRIRAVDGPYRGHWFRFYPDNAGCICPLWPFCGDYQDIVRLDSRDTVDVYRITQSSDPTKWALAYEAMRSIEETRNRGR